MAYTLMGSLRSPFVRIVRLFMIAHKIPFDFKVVNYLEVKEDAEFLARENPINKIPILLDDEQKIFDSRVIVNHLTRKHQIPLLTLDEENIVSAVYAALDASVNLFLLKSGGLDLDTDNWYLKRQGDRIPRTLAFVAPWARQMMAANPRKWNYASMSLFSYLFWGTKRGLLDVSNFPDLEKFIDVFANESGVQETDFSRPQ